MAVLENMDKRALGYLAVSHMFNDVNQGAVPALLPFLVTAHSLTYTQASGIILSATLISSLIQPLLGLYSDKNPIPWLMPLGVLMGGMGIALVGFLPQYSFIIASVLVSGMGVAAFHPEGSRFANYVSGSRAAGMSVFTVGGNAGFTLGPILITPMLLTFGLPGTLFMAFPAALISFLLYRELPRMVTFRPPDRRMEKGDTVDRPAWGAFSRLTLVIVLRTALYFSLMSFVPLYYMGVRGVSIAESNSALAVLLASGAAGGVLGGFIADRIGLKRLLVCSLFLVSPLLWGFLSTTGIFSLACLSLVGASVIGSAAVSVLMGQSYLKNNIGVASGITLGSAIGMGGAAVPITGLIADHYGLENAMLFLLVLPIIAFFLAQTLPSPEGLEIPTK